MATKLFVGGAIGRNSLDSKHHGAFGTLTSAYAIIITEAEKQYSVQVDLGSGSTLCADWLKKEGLNKPDVTLMTHAHWDHLAGDQNYGPFFTKGDHPVYFPQLSDEFESDIRDYLRLLTKKTFWPVNTEMFDGSIVLNFFEPGDTLPIAGSVKTLLLPHPGGCVGYRIGDVVIATDCELVLEKDQKRLAKFCVGAQCLIIDVQYRDEEYEGTKAINGGKPMPRIGWGHNSRQHLMKLLKKMKRLPKCLLITHHDPDRGAEDLMRFSVETDFDTPKYCKVEFASEGKVYEF